MENSNYFTSEFKRIFSKRSVLISVAIVLFVPLIYAMIMLSPKWGPQDNIDNVPVAVVNNDNGADQDGTVVNVGDELVENLKANPTLGWDFVSSEEANQGMDDMEYYMLIEVPEDFSQKVITVMDDVPERPELKFIQNEGLHYMAAQVTDRAIDTIKEQLSTQITQTYVENVIDQLGDVGDGFTEAADGAFQINDGSIQLKDGSDLMLSSLTEKSGDIGRLADGSKELHAGTNELLTNLNDKSPDISRLADGANELSAGAGELKSGTGELKAGAGELKAGAGELKAGTDELKSGTGELKAGTKELKDGTNELKDGSSQILDGSKQLKDGSATLRNGVTKDLAPGVVELADGVKQAQTGVNETIESMSNLQESLQFLSTLDKDHPMYDGILNEVLTQLEEGLKDAPQKKKDFQRLVDGANELQAKTKKGSDLYSGVIELNEGLKELYAGASDLDEGAKQLSAGASELDAGASELNSGASELNAGASELNAGAGELNAGAGELDAGAGELTSGAVQVADGNQTVRSGWSELQDGATQLHDGSTQISEGNDQVKDGWEELTDGADQLDDGLLQVVDGSEELHEGLEGGAEQVGELDPQEDNIAMFAEPVVLDGEVINSFPFYRDANAPYIITLALFVGVLAMSFVIPYRKPAITPASAISWFSGKISTLAILAVTQALIISLYSLLVLRIEVHSSIQFILFSIWVSLTFLMIVLFLVALAGNIGRFAALAFAVVQLSTTGSDLPIHMLPEGLRNLSVFLPFTYSIDGFQNIVTLGSTSTVLANAGILFIYLATFAILSGIVFFIRYRRMDREMEYEDEVTESTM